MSARSSHLSFDSGPPLDDAANSEVAPAHLQRNLKERSRLQGLMHAMASAKPGHIAAKREGLSLMERVEVLKVNDGGKKSFVVFWAFLHVLAFGLAIVHYTLKDNLVTARGTFDWTFMVARGSAQVLHIDVVFILFPVCRNFISLLRRTPLNDVFPLDKNITFHKQVAWAIVFFSVVHIVAHINNIRLLAIAQRTGIVGFLTYNFTTGPGITGWIMTIALGIMVWFAMEKKRRANFERFWYSHHLFIVFFIAWQLHGMFCMIQPDRPPFCAAGQIGVFWKYWLPGGALWVAERILREVRARHVTYISKVIQHPSEVIEVQIKKEHTAGRAGQYIFVNCPEISYFQYHPFTLTSAPEEGTFRAVHILTPDYLSVHIRVAGDWTTAFAKALGCDSDSDSRPKAGKKEKSGAITVPSPLTPTLPRVMLDGPFGSASEDFTKFETILLVGAGIGVTPFASMLKSIWYRLNGFSKEKKPRLSKVYFVWVIRDFGAAEWFHSLLPAVEAEDTDNRIEIHIYLTAKIKDEDVSNILVQDVNAEKDSITSLQATTHFRRPNWDKVFEGIANKHIDTDCGVFFCGPLVLSRTLHSMSNKYTTPKGCRFFFGKENF